uniref:Uncharacterized protein n=1 Tax=Sinocyclocheilus grahami TaxID=75366 RepID=A0A672NUQ4_SINGR
TNDLNKINPMYQFSLKAFNVVFHKAVQNADASSDVKTRVNALIACITFSTFNYINRGFMLDGCLDPRELDFLLRFNIDHSYVSPLDFLSNSAWSAVKVSTNLETQTHTHTLPGSECPEKEKLPQEWKNKSLLQKLILMRALQPDRMTYALRNVVEVQLGVQYTEGRKMEFARSFKECGPASPVFFILSPGVDPLKYVESLCKKKLGFTIDLGKLHNVSLGQGQEYVAELATEKASKEGHWVILQNIHPVAKCLGSLEKLLERCCVNSHQDYRVFMSAEPSLTPPEHIIPQGILENSIKINNEPPTGMLANLHAALDNFDQDILDQCSREQEFKTILFSLCYFHASVAERRKFGPQGWNRKYPFNTGDLSISVNVLYNYLEANSQVPSEDLCYLFGEIMYGGHITDDWDRRLCRIYLEEYMQPNQVSSWTSGNQLPEQPRYIVVWENVCFHRAALVLDWFTNNQRFSNIFLPAYSPFLNPIEEFFSAWQWKVYDREPYIRAHLLQAMEEACLDISVDACQGWIRHTRGFYPRCLARANIACDVDEILWPDPEQRWDAEAE